MPCEYLSEVERRPTMDALGRAIKHRWLGALLVAGALVGDVVRVDLTEGNEEKEAFEVGITHRSTALASAHKDQNWKIHYRILKPLQTTRRPKALQIRHWQNKSLHFSRSDPSFANPGSTRSGSGCIFSSACLFRLRPQSIVPQAS